MPTPLTAPSRDTANPAAQRTQVRIIGDRVARDYEFNEAQSIQDQRRQAGLGAIFRHGGIVREAGGTIGEARTAVGSAGITARASTGADGPQIRNSQQYTIGVHTDGVPGVARLTVTSNGPDNSPGKGFIETLPLDPLDGSVTYAVGTEGVRIAFIQTSSNIFLQGDLWLISTLHERQLPRISRRTWVAGGSDPGTGPTTEVITLPEIDVVLNGDVFTVPATAFPAIPETSGLLTIYVEMLTMIVNAASDPSIADTLSTNPVAERLAAVCAYRTYDPTPWPLPDKALRRDVVAVYVWDRAKPYTDPLVVKRALDFPLRVALDQLPGQLGPDSLARLDLNQELQGHLALRDHEVWGSFIVNGLGVQQSTNQPDAGKVNVTVDAGIARVNGLRVEVHQPTEVALDAAIEVGAVVGESLGVFSHLVTDYPLNKSRVARGTDGFPIAAVSRVLSQNVAVDAPVTRSTTADYDHVDDAMTVATQIINATVGGTFPTTIVPMEQSATVGTLSAGGTTITVTAGTGGKFATTGKVRLEPGVAGKDETVTLTARSVDVLTVTGVTQSHASGSVIQQEHFRAEDGNIRWRETGIGKIPFQGKTPVGTYTVQLQKSLVLSQGPGGDYELVDKDGDNALDTIRFHASPPATLPVDGTIPSVDYSFYLKRRDILYLRQDGTLGVAEGIPAEMPIARGPAGRFLTLADVLIPPATAPDALRIKELKHQAISMQQLHNALQLVDDIRHDLVQQKLLNQVTGLDRDFRLADADALISDAKIDWGFKQLGGTGGSDAGVLIETKAGLNILAEVATLGGGHLRLPRTLEEKPLTVNLDLVPLALTRAIGLAHWACLPYSQVAVIDQTRYSEARNINSFLAYSPPDPRIILDPSEDFWIQTTQLYEGVVGSLEFQLTQDTWQEAGAIARLPMTSPTLPGRRIRFDWITSRLEEVDAIYMRPIEVTIHGRHFYSAQNLGEQVIVQFDGKTVTLLPIEGTKPGTAPGSVLVSADEYSPGVNPQLVQRGGDFAARFTIPSTVKTGIREVLATGNHGSLARANFTSFGIERTIHNIAHLTVLRSPLAQTFAFKDDTVLTRIDVPFADKYVRVLKREVGANGLDSQGRREGDIKTEATLGALNDPMILEVREVITPGGYPGPRFFEQVPRSWRDIEIGPNSNNSFAFPDMVMQPAETFYAVAFRNVGNEFQVYTATMTRGDLSPTGGTIDINPNIRPGEDQRLSGVVLDSLNNDYWESPDPLAPGSTIALRATLYRASFSTDPAGAYVYMNPVTFTEPVAYVFLVLQQFTMDATESRCEISWDGSVWHPITPFQELALPSPQQTLRVRTCLRSENERRSVFVRMDNATLVGAMPQTLCEYIQKRVISTALPDTDSGGAVTITGLVYFEIKPGSVEPAVYLSNGEAAAERPIWEPCDLDGDRTAVLPDGWQARQYKVQFVPQASIGKQQTNYIRLRIHFRADTNDARINAPEIRSIGWSVGEFTTPV